MMDNATNPDWTNPPPVIVFQLHTLNREHAILHTLGGNEIKIWFHTRGAGQSNREQPSLSLAHLTTVALLARTAMKHLADTADNEEYRQKMRGSAFRVFRGDQELGPAQGLIALMGPEYYQTSS